MSSNLIISTTLRVAIHVVAIVVFGRGSRPRRRLAPPGGGGRWRQHDEDEAGEEHAQHNAEDEHRGVLAFEQRLDVVRNLTQPTRDLLGNQKE
eukprot:scaffold822_cov250-Pinguiococcus_pyrenoidosus.AAC.5